MSKILKTRETCQLYKVKARAVAPERLAALEKTRLLSLLGTALSPAGKGYFYHAIITISLLWDMGPVNTPHR